MKEVKFMAEKSLLIGRAIPLNSIFEDNRYLLREYREFKIYDSDGKPTETVGGYGRRSYSERSDFCRKEKRKNFREL